MPISLTVPSHIEISSNKHADPEMVPPFLPNIIPTTIFTLHIQTFYDICNIHGNEDESVLQPTIEPISNPLSRFHNLELHI